MYGIDIFINFLSAYEDQDTGLMIIDMKKIAKEYVKGWFLIDLVATIPTPLLEQLF